MNKLILILLFISTNVWADYYDWQLIGKTPNSHATLKTIIDKNGNKIITEAKDGEDSNHAIPVVPVAPQKSTSDDNRAQHKRFGSQTPLVHARELMETKGIGGLVEARSYMDKVDSIISERNCTPGNNQPKFIIDQSDIVEAKAYANNLLETGGIGGAAAARKYTDMINGFVAAQNCTLGNYQQQREIKRIGNEVRSMKTQKIIDSINGNQ
jgi:hypothetical protein